MPLWWQRTEDDREIAEEVTVSGQTLLPRIAKAAASIRVDDSWPRQIRGKKERRCESACVASEREFKVEGDDVLGFKLWGVSLAEDVRVVITLPDNLIVGKRF